MDIIEPDEAEAGNVEQMTGLLAALRRSVEAAGGEVDEPKRASRAELARRDSAGVTAERVERDLERWHDLLTFAERRAAEDVVTALRQIAGGER